jgi:hypothetical protein
LNREIPALKIKPDTISYILSIIKKNEHNYSVITNEIYAYLINLSKRTQKPSPKNLVRAVALPSLRHLKLIEGDENDIQLTPQGNSLYYSSLNNLNLVDDSKFRKEFAKYLILLEEKYYVSIINELKTYNKIKISDFSIYLFEEKNYKFSFDRFHRWLNYLKYVGFISVQKKMIVVNQSQILNAQSNEKPPSLKYFREKLIESYLKLAPKSEFLGYVPIPLLKNEIYSIISNLWDQDFYDMLPKINREDNNTVIAFSEPMKWVNGGINIDGKYYYYIYIRKKGDVK